MEILVCVIVYESALVKDSQNDWLSLSHSALWIMAAKFEMEDRNSSESARHLFLRALRFHPESEKIYQEVKEPE